MPSYLHFDNQSGDDAVVRVFDDSTNARVTEVMVPDKTVRGTSMARGRYYIVVRYGEAAGRFRYTRGDAFDIKPRPGKRLRVTITLHAVKKGRYHTRTTSKKAFDQ